MLLILNTWNFLIISFGKKWDIMKGGTVIEIELACRLENPNDNQPNFDENWTSTLI